MVYQNQLLMGNQNKSGGLFEESEKSGYKQLKEDLSKTCKCSLKTRVMGWIICFVIGWILSIFATIIFVINRNTVMYAILYSFGQILNITGSCFLSGPKGQLKDMFKKSRLLLTLLYLGSLIATLVLAFLLPENLKGLVLVTLVIQMFAYFLYTFSYVPFGQKILKKFCQCILTD